jgi:hypothetical protein
MSTVVRVADVGCGEAYICLDEISCVEDDGEKVTIFVKGRVNCAATVDIQTWERLQLHLPWNIVDLT